MWPDRVSNPGPLTSESSALPTALRSARRFQHEMTHSKTHKKETIACSIIVSIMFGNNAYTYNRLNVIKLFEIGGLKNISPIMNSLKSLLVFFI